MVWNSGTSFVDVLHIIVYIKIMSCQGTAEEK